MLYSVEYTNRFKKDVKRCNKRGFDMSELVDVVDELQQKGELPAKYKPHKLKGDFSGLWECHIKPDWLLVWEQNDEKLILLFMYTGTHADLFK